MVLTSCKLARSPEQNWRRNVEIGFTAIYAMNISAQSAMTREVFPQMMVFLYYLYRIINIKVRFLFSCPLGHFIMQWSHQCFSAYLLENDEAQLKNSNYIVLLFTWLCSIEIHLFKSKSTKKPQEQSVRPQRRIQNPVEYLNKVFCENTWPLSATIFFPKIFYADAYLEPCRISKIELMMTEIVSNF